MVAGIALVAVWLLSGPLLGLGVVGVVLLGVLLLAAFHTLVQRQPLRPLLMLLVLAIQARRSRAVGAAVVAITLLVGLPSSAQADDHGARLAEGHWLTAFEAPGVLEAFSVPGVAVAQVRDGAII